MMSFPTRRNRLHLFQGRVVDGTVWGYHLWAFAPTGCFAVVGGGKERLLPSPLRPGKFDFIRTHSWGRHIGGESL